MAVFKGVLSGSLFFLNTIFLCLLLYPFALLKLLVPQLRRVWARIMVSIAETWISINDLNMAGIQDIRWDVKGDFESLSRSEAKSRSYLICANHRSWVDIVVLQHIFNRRIPFQRFFIKNQLIYVPFLGAAWWALDFPFMKRYSQEFLKKHPEKRGKDLETTKKACSKFKGTPISIINFLEGTRFSASKHLRQVSPYRHLLKPKAGGIAFVLDAMGDQFDSLLDVTIWYPRGTVDLWGMFSGRLSEVVVRVKCRPIPSELLNGDYLNDPQFRDQVQAWVGQLWLEKDQLIEDLARSVHSNHEQGAQVPG